MSVIFMTHTHTRPYERIVVQRLTCSGYNFTIFWRKNKWLQFRDFWRRRKNNKIMQNLFLPCCMLLHRRSAQKVCFLFLFCFWQKFDEPSKPETKSFKKQKHCKICVTFVSQQKSHNQKVGQEPLTEIVLAYKWV